MKINYRTRKIFMQALSIALVCIVAFGAIMGFSALYKKLNEETTVIKPSFTVGGLDSQGKYLDTKGSIYTKESFKCKGLEIKLDFDSNVKYQAFFYDALDNFIASSSTYEESVKLTVPTNAVYARLVVTPIWGTDVERDDRVCHWYDVNKYAKQIEVRVLKEQDEENEVLEVALFESLASYNLSSVTLNEDILYIGTELYPVAYQNNHFAGETITKIRIPVAALNDCNAENTYTVSVATVSADFKTVNVVDTYVLKLKAGTFTSNSPLDWAEFETNIVVGEGQTLVFGASGDTIRPFIQGSANNSGDWYGYVGTSSPTKIANRSLMFDIYVADNNN